MIATTPLNPIEYMTVLPRHNSVRVYEHLPGHQTSTHTFHTDTTSCHRARSPLPCVKVRYPQLNVLPPTHITNRSCPIDADA